MKRVTGHALLAEGAPYDDHGQRIWPSGHAGPGRAKCQCGVMSAVLPSARQRQAWHRQHKNDLDSQ